MSAVCDQLFFLPLQSAISAADLRVLRETKNADPVGHPVFWSEFIGDQSNSGLKCLFEPAAFLPEFWPLVLYGEGGNGKTSIAMAFANRFATKNNFKPLFEKASDLVRRHRDAIQTDSISEFRKRLISADLLVIDDIQLLKGRVAVQSEVIKLLDVFSIRKKPLIVTMNQCPNTSDSLIPQLASRFSRGLVLPVNRPGPDARREIAIRLASRFEVELNDTTLDFIVEHCDFAVPRLTLLFSLFSQLSNPDTKITVDILKKILFGDRSHFDRDIQVITKTVSDHFDLIAADVRGKSRKQTTVLARSICIFLSRDLLQLSFTKIGQCFSGRDHSTIIHAYNNVLNTIKTDALLNATISELRRKLTDQFLLVQNP